METVRTDAPRAKVGGGFVLPLAWQLFAAWWCYRQGFMRLRTLRVWLALWEVQARRCRLEASRHPRLRLEELQKLVGGVGGEHLRADLRALQALGLASLVEGRWRFLSSPEELQVPTLDAFWRDLQSIPNAKRRVPLPRRVLRYLAGCGVRVLLATTLADALRLLYYREGVVSARGRCKSSWIATAFQVDLRGVKRARGHLAAIGLLVPDGGCGCSRERVFERRWGKSLRWNLDWEGPLGETPKTSSETATGLPPQDSPVATGLPPVESDNTLLSETAENQNPGLPGPASGSFPGATRTQPPEQPPTFLAIEDRDLTDNARSFELYLDATKRGLLQSSEAAELRFFGLIAHARRYGTKNQPGLLRALVERQRWHFVTQDDEEDARRRLRELRINEPATDTHPGGSLSVGSLLAGVLARLLPGAR